MMIKWRAGCLLAVFLCGIVNAAGDNTHFIYHITTRLDDKPSLQRGAKLYMNYCAGCHSLQYMRYNRVAKDIGIVDYQGKLLSDVAHKNLVFTGVKLHDTIGTAMRPADGRRWFGVAPPDLTLETRVRGTDWLYTYLVSFYQDDKRPWGTNNLVFPDVAMPNVLLALQGTQLPVKHRSHVNLGDHSKTMDVIERLQLVPDGTMSKKEFSSAMVDLVNFFEYVATPEKLQRESLGKWVLLFLGLFLIICYLLKREFWKGIK